MNIDSIRIPPKHYPHFDLQGKIQALRSQKNDFQLYAVFPVDSLDYLTTGIISIRVSLPTEIDKELFEAWLDEQIVPGDFIITYNIGRSTPNKMLWDKPDPIEYHCCNCGVPVHESDCVEQWLQRYEYCEACWERGE